MRELEPLSDQTTLHWGMYREDVPREAVYSMSIYSFMRSEVRPTGFMAQPHVEQWPLKMARDTGLKIVARSGSSSLAAPLAITGTSQA